MCEHENFKAEVAVSRLTDETGKITGYTTDITVHCNDCLKPFEWIGVPGGVSPNHPCVDIERVELRAPIRPVI